MGMNFLTTDAISTIATRLLREFFSELVLNVRKMSKVGKITAEKLIEDRQGIEKLLKEFKDIDLLGKDQVRSVSTTSIPIFAGVGRVS